MNFWQRFVSWIVQTLGKVEWRKRRALRAEELEKIRSMLVSDYYIILTRRNNHLSTYMTSIGHFFLTGKKGFWAHAVMNMEDEALSVEDFRLVEAIGKGVTFSPFDKVFDVNAAVLLRPKNMTLEDWTAAFDALKNDIGKPYDTLFDLSKDNALSCVELVRRALQHTPNSQAKA
jgi:uncharacterized protein YycO